MKEAVKIRGSISLTEKCPELIEEWNYEKNEKKPEAYSYGSNKIVWWICKVGHEWQANISHRARGYGCPICSNQKVLPGYNDLATRYPDLVKEWHPTKNGNLTPDKVAFKSGRKVWWLCEFGHEWQSRIVNRSHIGHKCPTCSKKVSVPEKIIYYYLKQCFPSTLCNYYPKWLGGKEIDIYIPELDLSIEYDGERWHDIDRDNEKDKLFKVHNKLLIRVREPGLPKLNDNSICFYIEKRDNNYLYMEIAIRNILFFINKRYKLNVTLNIDIGKDIEKIYCLTQILFVENSLKEKNPDLAKEWHPTKNGNLSPYSVTLGSNKKVWWLCASGHEWKADISHRAGGCGCPICSNQKVLPGYNDLATKHPELIKEWNYLKNGELKPSDITPGSGKKVWWLCELGHEWKSDVSNRIQVQNCPICSGRRILSGYNDLATKYPKLEKQWDFIKNGTLTPYNVGAGSNKKVWWKCELGHEWEASISNRVKGCGCSVCSGRKVLVGYNDLASKYPVIAKQWHPNKNGSLTPYDITSGSQRKVWWKCASGHEWEAQICNRVNGRGCPICSNKKVLLGYNDLASKYPVIAKQWHPDKNGVLTPYDITAGSGKEVWWICELGHEWKEPVRDRTKGSGCRICLTKKNTNQKIQPISRLEPSSKSEALIVS